MKEEDLKECETLITNFKQEIECKANRTEEMFLKLHSVIHREKISLKHAQNDFQTFVGILKELIECDCGENDYSFVTLISQFQEKFEPVSLLSHSGRFSSDIKIIFHCIITELMESNFSKGDRLNDAISKTLRFLKLLFGKIKWIKEFKQMLECNKKPNIVKFFKPVPELEDQMEMTLSHILSLLEETINDCYTNKIPFEKSECSHKQLKKLSMIEMLTLDSMTILENLPNRLANNSFFLDSDYPIINGKNLRNHLAHGNALVSIVLGDDCRGMLLNAAEMRTKDLLKPRRQIGKKIKNDPQRLKISLAQDLSVVNEQIKLFNALTEGKIEEVEHCLRKGADMFARDLWSQTALHFAAKSPCLQVVKHVLKFNLDVSAVDINFQTPLHVASLNGNLAIVEYLIEELKVSINRRDIHGRTPLHFASSNGHTDVVRCLLKHRAEVVSKDLFGNAALHYAVIQNHTKTVSILLEMQPDDDDNKTFLGVSALHLASEKGHINLVSTLLKKINVNNVSEMCFVPVHYAALGGHVDIVQFLITNGADINAKSSNGMMPLHLAARRGHYAVVDVLLRNGAYRNTSCADGLTPLSVAVIEGFIAISKLLIENHAVVDRNENSSRSPINLAARFGHYELVKMMLHKCYAGSKISALHWSAYFGHLNIIELLINDRNIFQCGDSCYTALHLAAYAGHIDIVNFLILKGYDVNAKCNVNQLQENICYDKNHNKRPFFADLNIGELLQLFSRLEMSSGQTALHLSSIQKHKDIVRNLLKNHANIYNKDDTGKTPLRIIISMGMSYILIEENVPLNFIDYEDDSPLQLGAAKGDLLFVKYCVQNKCDINAKSRPSDLSALEFAVLNGHAEIVTYLIDCGADVNTVSRDGTTALKLAVQRNRKDIVSILIKNNAEINAEIERDFLLSAITSGHEDMVEYFLTRNPACCESGTEWYESPLHTAVLFGHLNIVKKLLQLQKTKDINAKNELFETPLHTATMNSYCEIARLLLLNGADPNVRDPFSPLDMAIRIGDYEMVETLINNGANITQQDADGNSTIELAIFSKNLDIMERLLERSKFDINLKGRSGHTLLHYAAISGSLQLVKHLVAKGATFNSRDSSGAKPIHLATWEGHQDIVEYFLNEGIDIDDRDFLRFWSLLHYAAAGNQSEMCKVLIKYGLNVNCVDANGDTPLHIAVRLGNVDVLHTLLHYGAYIHLFEEKISSIKILAAFIFVDNLFAAAMEKNVSKFEALLKEGLRLSKLGYANIKTVGNMTLLHCVSWKGYEEFVDLLLKYNADPNARSESGFTPLHFAAACSHPRIVRALLRSGAMFDAENNSKKTPVNYAADIDIIEHLDLLKVMFSKIQNKENFVSDHLTDAVDLDTAKTLMRAKNSDGKTLTAFAVIKKHPEVEMLKSMFQSGVNIQIRRADILYVEGRLEESLQQYKIILQRRVDLFGDEDPGVLDIQEDISKVLFDQENYDEAQNIIENVYIIRRRILGDCNEETLVAMGKMALVLINKGKKKEALQMYEDAVGKQKYILGSDHAKTIKSEIHVVQLMCEGETECGTFSKALKMSLEILEKLNKSRMAASYSSHLKIQVAKLLRRLGKPNMALDIYEEIFEIQKETYGLYDPATSDTLFQMAENLYLIGEKERSLNAFKKTYEIWLQILGPNNKKTLDSRLYMAHLLFSQRMFDKAFEIYSGDLEARTAVFGVNHTEILDTQERMNFIRSHIPYH
ncbi:serine/threonine-protein phosphatase 6 regulatory ankyrin repeat subunit B-like [Argiope bruennichi]|uniref:serine/threonine-protein phosphatase 6 regulatory ankyrin repeat subunit B-like n=1 Tax=Argiope bruennichi TaxID=94029 RepID=UPI00249578DB|nr:serine/threonine-protein phosphatase 6 regulatory ankyrin repeat subunit B-like [Argiope bruennichi]